MQKKSHIYEIRYGMAHYYKATGEEKHRKFTDKKKAQKFLNKLIKKYKYSTVYVDGEAPELG